MRPVTLLTWRILVIVQIDSTARDMEKDMNKWLNRIRMIC